MGWYVRENERHPLPSRHGKVADRGQPLAPKLDRRAEEQHVRARNREEIAGLAACYPRPPTAVPEPDDQFHAHRHSASLADHQTHELGPGAPPAHGHEVDQDDRTAAVSRRKLGFEDQRVAPVAAPEPRARFRS